jgi:hypothetical protein
MFYLLGLSSRPGWTIRVVQVQHALGLGQGAWQRARRELQAVGYYLARRERDAAGQLMWIHEVTDEPGSIGAPSADGGSTGGWCTDIRNTKIHMKKKQKHARAREDAAAIDDQQQRQEQGSHKKGTVMCGVQCWTHDDRQEVERLVEAHGEDSVRGAADAVQAAGKKPLPSLVSAAIQAMTTALREQERRHADDFRRADELRRWQAAQAAPPSPTGRAALEATAKALRVPLSTCDVDL